MKIKVASTILAVSFGWLATVNSLQANPLDPTTFTSLGANPFDIDGTYTVHTSGATPTIVDPDSNTVATGVVSGGVAVFTFDNITVGAGVTVFGAREADSRPFALLSKAGITIDGTVDVSGENGSWGFLTNGGAGGAGGPGGGGGGGGGGGASSSPCCPRGLGGPGGVGAVPGASGEPPGGPKGNGGDGGAIELGGAGKGGDGSKQDTSGGGGAFGGDGEDVIDGAAGGTAYGDLALTLRGGSGAGGHGGRGPFGAAEGYIFGGGEGGGGGGGAVEIGAVNDVEILGGSINANGGAVQKIGSAIGGIGGGGGGVLVHGDLVTILGIISATGGSAHIGGGGGRVHIVAKNAIRANLEQAVNIQGSGKAGKGELTIVGRVCPLVQVVGNKNNSGDGSLRQAILDANSCPGKDIIEFADDVTGTITLTSGELLITDDLEILGPGANVLAVSGNNASRVFHIGSGINVTIAGLTITKGNSGNDLGGGIRNHGRLTLSDCTITGNSGVGGGIANSHSLTIIGSTISGNSGNSGSAIINYADRHATDLHIINCTLSSNSGSSAINMATFPQSVEILNSTFSHHTGGIYCPTDVGPAILTIGSTIFDDGSSLQLRSATGISRGYNLSSYDASAFLNQSTDKNSTDPLLGPLQLNGGQTPTHALLCGSPAIDQGKNLGGDTVDQTGFPRTFDNTGISNAGGGDGTDIGAFEVQNAAPVAVCKGATLIAGANCTVTVNPSDVDGGSSDPDEDTLLMSVTPSSLTAVGVHTVTLTVADCHRASSACEATVTVVDNTPPSLTCPGNQTFNATAPNGATVNYSGAIASDNCGGGVTINYSKNAGTLFPIGDTTVTVTAADSSGNPATPCSVNVHVKGAVEQINDLIAKVNALSGMKSPNKTALVTKLQVALAALASNKPNACAAMQDFIYLVKAQRDKKLIKAPDADALTADATRIRAVIGCP